MVSARFEQLHNAAIGIIQDNAGVVPTFPDLFKNALLNQSKIHRSTTRKRLTINAPFKPF
jgi:hypothetical protein